MQHSIEQILTETGLFHHGINLNNNVCLIMPRLFCLSCCLPPVSLHLLFVQMGLSHSGSLCGSNTLHVKWPHWTRAVHRPPQPGERVGGCTLHQKREAMSLIQTPIFMVWWAISHDKRGQKEIEKTQNWENGWFSATAKWLRYDLYPSFYSICKKVKLLLFCNRHTKTAFTQNFHSTRATLLLPGDQTVDNPLYLLSHCYTLETSLFQKYILFTFNTEM